MSKAGYAITADGRRFDILVGYKYAAYDASHFHHNAVEPVISGHCKVQLDLEYVGNSGTLVFLGDHEYQEIVLPDGITYLDLNNTKISKPITLPNGLEYGAMSNTIIVSNLEEFVGTDSAIHLEHDFWP